MVSWQELLEQLNLLMLPFYLLFRTVNVLITMCMLSKKWHQAKVQSGKTIIEEEISNKFLIKEETSYAFINDKRIKSYIVQDESYSTGFFSDATENLENYLNSKGYKSEGSWGFNKTLRYKRRHS